MTTQALESAKGFALMQYLADVGMDQEDSKASWPPRHMTTRKDLTSVMACNSRQETGPKANSLQCYTLPPERGKAAII
jgi:hypothetical protein